MSPFSIDWRGERFHDVTGECDDPYSRSESAAKSLAGEHAIRLCVRMAMSESPDIDSARGSAVTQPRGEARLSNLKRSAIACENKNELKSS